mmetsp:Transcript_11995/g.18798  ORF Transcript_11995/g.18798 Transcript_11995/m.18798 type:complete len:310 (+) Transcript_11995:983-1912(+)
MGTVQPSMYIDMFCVVLNALVAYMFVFKPLELGLVGAALATSVVRSFRTIAFCVYCFGTHPQVRSGEAWQLRWWWQAIRSWGRWKELLSLAIPAGLGQALEELQFQAVAFLAAKMGTAAISAQNLAFCVLDFFWIFSEGVGEAIGVRVANALGSDRASCAKRSVVVGISMTTIVGIILGVSLLFCGHFLFSLTSTDPKVVEQMCLLIPYASAIIILLVDLAPVYCILQKQGRTTVATCTFAICAWGIAFPLCYTLKDSMGLPGLWFGLLVGYGVALGLVLIFLLRSDWEQLAKEARKRSERTTAEELDS